MRHVDKVLESVKCNLNAAIEAHDAQLITNNELIAFVRVAAVEASTVRVPRPHTDANTGLMVHPDRDAFIRS